VRKANRTMNCLRGGAALLVVVGHLRALLMPEYSQTSHSIEIKVFYGLTSLGRQAVYVFFALSGYWVGGWVLRRFREDAFSWEEHLVRRLSRLWTVLIPALLVVLVVDTIGRTFFGNSAYYAGTHVFHGVAPVSHATHLSPIEAVGNVAFLQGYWVHPFGTDDPLWTLAYEFWYYLLFPLLLISLSSRRPSAIVTALVGTAICALAAGPTALTLFPAWLVGVVAYVVSRRTTRWLKGLSAGVLAILQLGSGGAVLATILVAQALHFPTPLAALVDAAATSAFLVLAAVEIEGGRLLNLFLALGHRGGDMSYTLYAIHLPVLLLLCAALNDDGSRSLGIGTFALFVGLLLACLAVAFRLSLVTERQTSHVREWLAWRVQSARRARSRSIPTEAHDDAADTHPVARGIVARTVDP
jgi:peptidoglycan/LPS O-acetylase OafA/YrhL